jgi:hypothetical protein
VPLRVDMCGACGGVLGCGYVQCSGVVDMRVALTWCMCCGCVPLVSLCLYARGARISVVLRLRVGACNSL